MSYSSMSNEDAEKDENLDLIKKLLKTKNLNPKKLDDLKGLLSLTLRPKLNNNSFNKNLLRFLLEHINKTNESIFYNFFFQSCEVGNLSNVKLLLEKGLDVNCQNDLGETPLHIAVAKMDIKLIRLLIKYEPKTNIKTYKDSMTAVNYAEIRGDGEINKLINDLNKSNKAKIIRSEILDCINKDMDNLDISQNEEDNSLFQIDINDNNEINNYNGEAVSIITGQDVSTSRVYSSNNINKSNVNSIINVYKKEKEKKEKEKEKKKEKRKTIIQTLLNESDFCEINSPIQSIKTVDCRKSITDIKNKFRKTNENSDNNIERLSKNTINENKIVYFPIKKKDDHSNNPSCLQSLKTSHTLNKDQYESLFLNKSINKKLELYKFMSEISLSKSYADYLLDNGFDDLEVLIHQYKNSNALSEKNLKDIGIKNPGDRTKILIHLEELAGNFPIKLEKNIIYSNFISKDVNNSLYKFLNSINLEKYIDIFEKNGFYNAEILYIKMISKNPMTEEILREDFGLDKIGHIKRIMINLKSCSEQYIAKLKQKKKCDNYKYIEFSADSKLRSCQTCILI